MLFGAEKIKYWTKTRIWDYTSVPFLKRRHRLRICPRQKEKQLVYSERISLISYAISNVILKQFLAGLARTQVKLKLFSES